MKLSLTFRCVLISLLLACLGTLKAADLSDEIHQTEQKLGQLEKLDATGANKQLKEIYQQILSTEQEQAQFQDKTKTLGQQLKDHAAHSRELKQAIETESQQQTVQGLTDKPTAEIERLMEAAAAEKLSLQNQLEETQNRLANLQARLVPAQNELTEAKKNLELAAKESKSTPTNLEPNAVTAVQLKKRKSYELLLAQIKWLELEILSIPNQSELAGLKKELLNLKLKNLGQNSEHLQMEVRQRRRAESASLVSETHKQRNDTLDDPALKWLADENIHLGEQLTAYVEKNQHLSDRRASIEQTTRLIEERHSLLRQQLELGGEAEGTGELMRQTVIQLKLLGRENTAETIIEIQRAQIQTLNYLGKRNETNNRNDYIESVVRQFPKSQLSVSNNEMRERLNILLDLRLSLIQKLLERNQQTLKNWGALLNAQNQLNDQISTFHNLLMENLLWTATNRAMSPAWFKELLTHTQWDGLAEIASGVFLALQAGFLILLTLIFTFGLWLYFLQVKLRPRYRSWLNQANQNYGNVRLDQFRNTLYMFAWECLVSLPAPLLMLALSVTLVYFGKDEAWAWPLARILKIAAFATFALNLLRRLCRPCGFLEGQLRWPSAVAASVHRFMGLRWLPILLYSYVVVVETQTDNFFRYESGRLPFLIFCLSFAVLLRRLAKQCQGVESKSDSLFSFKRALPLVANSFALSQLLLAGMEVAGFHLGAFTLQGRLLRTLAWGFGVVLAYQIIERWLILEGRRMAYAKALAIRAERRAAEEEAIDESNLEIQRKEFAEIHSISLQSQTLMRLLSGVALVGVILWIWSDLIPALYLLDQIVLWEVGRADGSTTNVEAITLKSLLEALAYLALTLLATYSLPGLLRLLVLQHIELAQGSDFAITTMLRNSVFVIGVVSVFHVLGVQWSDLQWLVAALGVGLGFGLQEIFANFISGIILLFERPVRIGDIVTLSNGVTGTIEAINTRATTLTDWDNKDIIIPNKTLITQQLTNWSLSSPVIRLIIPVGIAYGSDPELACQLLKQAATEHPMVLDKPEMSALFLGFGDSTLNIELRCFVSSPAVRGGVTHDLNLHIKQLFAESGIEIAFPQMDVHIRKDLSANAPLQAEAVR